MINSVGATPYTYPLKRIIRPQGEANQTFAQVLETNAAAKTGAVGKVVSTNQKTSYDLHNMSLKEMDHMIGELGKNMPKEKYYKLLNAYQSATAELSVQIWYRNLPPEKRAQMKAAEAAAGWDPPVAPNCSLPNYGITSETQKGDMWRVLQVSNIRARYFGDSQKVLDERDTILDFLKPYA